MTDMKANPQFKKLHTAIHARLEHLTPTERKIASYILEKTHEIALVSVQELALRLKTGPASIMRVVKKLGYKGLSELKSELRNDIRSGGSPVAAFKSALSHGTEPGLDEIRLIADNEMKNIGDTIALLNQDAFIQSVDLILNANHIYTVGIGTSSHLAGITAFLFRRIGLNADSIAHTGLRLTESMIALGKGDVLIAFSLPPYSEPTLDAAILAKKQGVSIIGVTNRLLAPIAEHCNAVLVGKSESRIPANSLSALLVLVYGLTAVAAAKSRKRSYQALEKTMKLRKKKQS
jgi:DNA-binding MurR/RpiR family transcriptional regulator